LAGLLVVVAEAHPAFILVREAMAAVELYASFGARAVHTRQRTPRTFKGKTWQIYQIS
jgi:hypothetical protein